MVGAADGDATPLAVRSCCGDGGGTSHDLGFLDRWEKDERGWGCGRVVLRSSTTLICMRDAAEIGKPDCQKRLANPTLLLFVLFR